MSRLDATVTALTEAPEDEARARALYAALAGTELCLLLAAEAEGETIAPKLFALEAGPVALAFDSEERLTEFAGPAPFVALSGRALAALFDGKGIGLGLNLGTHAEYVLPPDALSWIAEQQVDPQMVDAQPTALHPPDSLPEALLPEIEARLAAAQGLAARAVLVDAEYAGGVRRPLVAFVGAQEGREAALSAMIGEVLAIAGFDPASLDLLFLPEAGPLVARLEATGLVVDLPQPPTVRAPDPTRPPRLR